jgi:DNA-binding FrmR family transcriptional regulator
MTHTSAARNKLLNRIRRSRGQVDALALIEDGRCTEVLQLIAVARGVPRAA